MRRILRKSIKALRSGGITALTLAARRKLRISRRNRVYSEWIEKYDLLTDADCDTIRKKIETLEHKPLISVLMPVYNVEERYLREAIDSVRAQLYGNWELCIADDCSPSPHIRRILDEYMAADERIRVVYRETNGHISAASNSALEIVHGEFTALMDHDDRLSEDALFRVALAMNTDSDVNMIYSDEDKIDASGRRYQPMFKPDWSIELFRSLNLVTHLCAFRTEILRKIGGFRVGLEGSQDYDLSLRFTEQIDPETIVHIPLVLYHWRAIPGSVALDSTEKTYAHERAREAIREHYKRIGVDAEVTRGVGELHRTIYKLNEETRISLIVTKDVDSSILLENAGCSNVELIEATSASAADQNAAAASATGSVIVFVGAPVIGASTDWLIELVARAVQDGVGAAGLKIADERDRILHAGYILGINGGVGRPHLGYHAGDQGEFERLAVDQNFSAVSGECIAIRRELFNSIGGFDETTFPENYADIDLCLRLQAEGLRIVWTPWAKVRSASARELPHNGELAALNGKWQRSFDIDPYYNPNLTLEAEDLSFAFPPRCRRTSF